MPHDLTIVGFIRDDSKRLDKIRGCEVTLGFLRTASHRPVVPLLHEHERQIGEVRLWRTPNGLQFVGRINSTEHRLSALVRYGNMRQVSPGGTGTALELSDNKPAVEASVFEVNELSITRNGALGERSMIETCYLESEAVRAQRITQLRAAANKPRPTPTPAPDLYGYQRREIILHTT